MFDHMTMPVLFAIMLVVLAVVSIAVLLILRVVGERSKASDEPAARGRRRP